MRGKKAQNFIAIPSVILEIKMGRFHFFFFLGISRMIQVQDTRTKFPPITKADMQFPVNFTFAPVQETNALHNRVTTETEKKFPR